MANKDNKPWDLPNAPKPQGDSDAATIYLSVGNALSEFERMQSLLSHLFCTLARSSSLALMRAYGTLESVPNKVRMAEHAANITLADHSELRKQTLSALQEVNHFSQRRNDIAHGGVIALPHGHYLAPGDHASTKISNKAGSFWTYCLTAAEIDNYAKEFRRIMETLSALNHTISQTLGQDHA